MLCVLTPVYIRTYMTGPSMHFVHCGMVAVLHWLQLGAKNVHLSMMWMCKANCVSSPSSLGLPVFA